MVTYRPRWRWIGALLGAACVSAGALAAVAALAIAGPLPADPATRLRDDPMQFLDRNGTVLYAPAEQGLHRPITLERVSPSLVAAVLATEDRRYFDHPGINPLAIGRALVDNLRAGRSVSGAGTITQQVVRDLYLAQDGPPASRYGRKGREALLALRLDRQLSKNEVLTLYLNHAYLGNLAYGIEAAAWTYFGRPARDLDLAESALLAGLLQAPARYDPVRYPQAARARQSVVLDLMLHSGAITAAQAAAARAEPLTFAPVRHPIIAPHFVLWAREQVEAALGPAAAHGGLRVITTLDLGAQQLAEETVRGRMAALAENGAGNAAVVALEPATGAIRAMVGSAAYHNEAISGAVNMALAPRQPGSAIKPLLYGLALEGEITAATPLLDVPTAFSAHAGASYRPNNYDGRFHGVLPVREALAGSYNVPAVGLLNQIGIPRFLATAAAAGISTFAEADRFDLSLILGGGEVPLLELTAAYTAFANGGEWTAPVAIHRIEDARGRVVWQPPAPHRRRVFSPEAAWLVTDILADNTARAPAFGLSSPLLVNRPAAAKTGTTSDFRDNWTVGYTPDLVVGVWVGNTDHRSMRDVSGISGAAPIWHDLIEDLSVDRPARAFARPPGLVRAEVCVPGGGRPGPVCQRRRLEWFKAGTEPNVEDTYYQALPICTASEAPASGSCAGPVVTRVFEFPPPEALAWARASGRPLPPLPGYARESGATQPARDGPRGAIRLVSPLPGVSVRISRALPSDVQALVVAAEVFDTRPDAVQVLLNGQPIATLATPPWQHRWPLSEGRHVLTVVAYQDGELLGQDEVVITVLPP